MRYLNIAYALKKGEETEINSGFTEENLLPTRGAFPKSNYMVASSVVTNRVQWDLPP